jgi:hypothetical protein
MITGKAGGEVGMELTLVASIMNPGHQSLAKAQHLWGGGEDIFDINVQEMR